MKRPAFQFYPADWRKDAALQSCSMAAQGLWMNLLCVMHECEPYGHLSVNGKPMQALQAARLVGLGAKDCSKLLAELEAAGVSSVSGDGFLYSRRMVRDEDLRNRRAAGGSAGAEHGIKGADDGSKGGRPKKVRGVIYPPLEPPPSSSSSSSSSEIKEKEITPEVPVFVDRSALNGHPPPVGYRVPDCPYAELLAIFHAELPTLPRVEVFNDARKAPLRARWVEVCAAEKFDREGGLAWFADFFRMLGKSAFLTGKSKDWKASFDWLTKPKNFAKALEGNYQENRP